MAQTLQVPGLIYQLICKLRGAKEDSKSLAYEATMCMFNKKNQQDETQYDETDEFYILEKLKKHLASEEKQSDVIRLEELYFKLKRVDCVTNPISQLVFFFKLYNLQKKTGSQLLSKNSANFQLTPQIDTTPSENNFRTPLNLRRDVRKKPRPITIHGDPFINDSKVIAQNELLRELMLALQGLNGNILQQEIANDRRYRINPQCSLNPSEANHVLRISNVGTFYANIIKYCERVAMSESMGFICQSFVEAIREELNRYLRVITYIDQQIHADGAGQDGSEFGALTLSKLEVWLFDYSNILRYLLLLIEQCKDKFGGALINVVYKNMRHGDPLVRQCMNRLLSYIALPLRKMLSAWLFYGELDDPYREFFIIINRSLATANEIFWHERYSINQQQLPDFISSEQAKRILATGKAVTLLKQLGTSYIEVNYFEQMKKAFENVSLEKLFADYGTDEESDFLKLLTLAYQETNTKALQILFREYNLINHLQGLRQFLLLGQGDFINHLMDKLAPILAKPAEQLRQHNLNALLVSAIRSTNAEYMIEDVTDRLDVAFADYLPGQNGWEVFTLKYQTRGAISTVLTPACMEQYNSLFRYLWRLKRMEYILDSIWKKIITNSRHYRPLESLRYVLNYVSILHREMLHFVQQMQYYIRFEVLECSWATFESKIEAAEDIDQLVEAQRTFLSTVEYRLMMQSPLLSTQLRAIYDTIIDFEVIVNSLLGDVDIELERRLDFDSKKRNSPNSNGRNSASIPDAQRKAEDKNEFDRRRRFLDEVIANFKIKVQTLSRTYEAMVQKFLMQLADQYDADLRFLSFRLDFNEYYAKRNKSLECSFTYLRHKALETSRILESI